MTDTFAAELDISPPQGRPNALLGFDVLASAQLELPGLTANVEKLGVGVVFSLALDRRGKAGLIDYELYFKEPRGMGAELNLPPVTGAGYLEKVGNNELRGVFAANFGVIKVSALGVLGLDQFSMLVLLAGEFVPPLQLSFGFTLVGVGGLVGINRRVDDRELTAATSSGDLGKLLFPRDPVAEAPALLGTLSRCFPYEPGGMLIGPMVKMGWGTPTMISATLALIVSTADAKVVILGRIAVTLPFEDAALINLQAIIKGTIDQNGVAIDGSLAGSHICFMPIDGDLRLRMIASPRPLFALSVGGFYPGYPVPDGMAGMRRLSASLSSGPLLTMRLEAYTAITTSSVHFGARIELQIGFDGFGIHGFAGFDAFIQWEPYFQFAAHIEASVSVVCADFEIASISLYGEFGGPAQWHFRGGASFSILFFDIDIDLPEIVWGPKPEVQPDPDDPLAAFVKVLEAPANWSAASSDVPQIVMLRSGPGSEAAIHPLGIIGFRQRAVPLDTEFKRFQGVILPHPVTMRVAPTGEDETATARPDQFVPSQFFDQDQNARMTQTGYVDLPAGLDIRRGSIDGPPGAARICAYEIKELHSERLWDRARVELNGASLLAGIASRTVEPPPKLIQPVDPRVTTPLASAAFTNAAGVQLASIAPWELQV